MISAELPIVWVDFDRGVIEGLQAQYPGFQPLPRQSFHIADDYLNNPILKQAIQEIYSTAGFLEQLEPVQDALEGWQRIWGCGLHPRVCSSPLRANRNSEEEKRSWLNRMLGSRAVEEAIFDCEKGQHSAIALIDDRADPHGFENATWQHIVFDQPYNQGPQQPRLRGWRDPLLCYLLRDAAGRHGV